MKLFSQWHLEKNTKVDWTHIKPPPADKACCGK